MAMLKVGQGFDYPVVPEIPFIQDLVGQEELKTLTSVIVYPNPTSDFLNVETGGEPIDGYKLVNIEGKELLTGQISHTESLISVEGIYSGMYFLQFYSKGVFLGAKQIGVQ